MRHMNEIRHTLLISIPKLYDRLRYSDIIDIQEIENKISKLIEDIY